MSFTHAKRNPVTASFAHSKPDRQQLGSRLPRFSVVILSDLGFFQCYFCPPLTRDQRWTKITLKSKSPQEEELSKKRAHTHTHKDQQRTHRNTETTVQERPVRDSTQGAIPRNFIRKSSSSLSRTTILPSPSLGRKPCSSI